MTLSAVIYLCFPRGCGAQPCVHPYSLSTLHLHPPTLSYYPLSSTLLLSPSFPLSISPYLPLFLSLSVFVSLPPSPSILLALSISLSLPLSLSISLCVFLSLPLPLSSSLSPSLSLSLPFSLSLSLCGSVLSLARAVIRLRCCSLSIFAPGRDEGSARARWPVQPADQAGAWLGLPPPRGTGPQLG